MPSFKPAVRTRTAAAIASGDSAVKAEFDSGIGIDVRRNIVVCAYQSCDTQAGEIHTEVAEFGTTFSALQEMVEWVRQRQPQRIVMESTGVLWLSPYEALERAGFTSLQLALVDARDFKADVGRKTELQDAVRLAEYARLGNVRAAWVLPRELREQRQIAREIVMQSQALQRYKSRLLKTLNFVGCRRRGAVSDASAKAARKIFKEYIKGGDLRQAAENHDTRRRHTPQEIEDILSFELSEDMRELLRIQLREIERAKETIDLLWSMLRRMQQRQNLACEDREVSGRVPL